MDLLFFIDLGRFYMISTIWHIDRIDLGIFGKLGLVNLSGFVNFFCGFELFWWIWADFNRFGWICVDLG